MIHYLGVLVGLLAQLAEQQTLNLWVIGSIPMQPTSHLCRHKCLAGQLVRVARNKSLKEKS